MKKGFFFLCCLITMTTLTVKADVVRISQIDTSQLLLNQTIALYVSITDNGGKPIEGLDRGNFEIFESSDNQQFIKLPPPAFFHAGINDQAGVTFLLLIDNSESMYWSLEGDKKPIEANRRMTIVQQAVQSFLATITNPNDKIGIGAYNSYYYLLAKPTRDLEQIKKAFQRIERPTADAIYSEIYGSLRLAVDELNTIKGRKAIIVLTDGVNNPAFPFIQKINSQFGEANVSWQKPLDALRLEGITLYVINFGSKNDKKDRQLKTIAAESGGVNFDAHNPEELKQVYLTVKNQVQKEYLLSYQATMTPSDLKYVRVTYLSGDKKESGTRTYISTTLFGQPQTPFNPLTLLAFILAIGLLLLLSKLKFEKQHSQPSIEVFSPGDGSVSTKVLTLENDQTVIGCSPEANLTIAGVPFIEERHATIVFDPQTSQYTLKGQGKIKVNNQPVVTKILEPGDFININGTTMIFDEGKEKK